MGPDSGLAAALQAMAEEALDAWDLRADAVELVALQENAVFRVRSADGPSYALRIHRPGYHDLAELNSELQWTSALNRAGIGVPAAISTRDGGGYARVAMPGSEQVRYAGVVEWVDGVQLESVIAQDEDAAAVARHFERLGRIAARIHNQAVRWPIPASFARHALDADGLLGEHPWWGRFWEVPELEGPERKLLEATRESLHAELSTWGRDRATYSLIHADLHPKNVLVDGERLHVIDFDDAGFGWHAYELAVALFSYQGQACFEAAREGLVAGYRAERPLDERTLERMPTFLLIRGLALIGWLHDRPELGLGPFVRVLIRSVCEQAETYCGKGGGARAARPD